MNKNSLRRVFNIAWINLRRNSYLSFGAIGTLTLTLILFLGLLSFQFLSGQVVDSIKDKIDVSVYFSTDAAEPQIVQVKSDLETMPLVQGVRYVSREQALADFKERHKNDQVIQDSLTQLDANPLQASLNIKSKDPSRYAEIVKSLEGNKLRSLIDEINYDENRGVIEQIRSISDNIQNWGLVVTLVVGMIAVLVTFNTIRLTIFNQKQEIEIMRLVGASNWHIRGPFLAEGGFYGLFSAGISLVVFYPVLYFVSDKINKLDVNLDVFGYFVSNLLSIGFLTILLGVVLGVISSWITIAKHLKI